MLNLNVYREVKAWKRPIHASRTLAAKSYLKILPSLDIIGITGSVGKTLTQNAIVSVLSQKFKTITPDENLDPTFRIPQTILAAKPWHKMLVLEYGVEHPGDMDHYLAIAKPKIAVVIAIAPTHTKYFKDIEGVFKEKVKLVESLGKDGYAVLNTDDSRVARMKHHTRATVKWFGQKAQNGIKISHFKQTIRGSQFRLHLNGQKATVRWKIIGAHQLTSAYAAATVGLIYGLTLKQIAKGLSVSKPPTHRLNAIVTKQISLIDDTYNSSPKAATEGIKTLIDLGKRRPKIAVLGEMKDLGTLSEEAHEKLGQKIAKSSINYLVTIGKTTALIAKSAKRAKYSGKIIVAANITEAIENLKRIITPRSLVLVKGSRHAHLERIVSGLLGRSTQITCYHCGVLK